MGAFTVAERALEGGWRRSRLGHGFAGFPAPAGRRRPGSPDSGLLLALRIVLVEPAADLLAEPAGGDVLPEQRARPVLVVAELAVQHLGDRQAGVEPDQVGQLERTHRVVEPEPHAG